jgi:hypothetical protein
LDVVLILSCGTSSLEQGTLHCEELYPLPYWNISQQHYREWRKLWPDY